MQTLNLEQPEALVRATEHIEEMARFIQRLADKDFAYRTEDGSYYFRIAKFPDYGKLSKKDFAGLEIGARVDGDENSKDTARASPRWKAPTEAEAFWRTPPATRPPTRHLPSSVTTMTTP